MGFEFKHMSEPLPTIVTMFYNIRHKERQMSEKIKSAHVYGDLARTFILKLPYPMTIYTDDSDMIKIINEERREYENITKIYDIKLEDIYYFGYLDRIQELQKTYKIYNINQDKDTPLYVAISNNKFSFVEKTINDNPFNSKHFVWLDFGINHVAKNCEEIHNWIHQIPDKVRQLCINPYVERVNHCDIFHNIYHHMAAGLFTGSADNLLQYCQLFKNKIVQIYSENWYQLDEAIMTIIHHENPELFDLFYGDYMGIISNYLSPIHNIELIIRGADKCLMHNNTKFAYHIIMYCINFFQQNKSHQSIYDFIRISIICSYYQNNQKLPDEIIQIINDKIINKDERMMLLINSQAKNINFYKNTDSILI